MYEGSLLFISEFAKLTVLNLTKLGSWDEGSIIKISFHEGNINIISFWENFKGANPMLSIQYKRLGSFFMSFFCGISLL